MSYCTSLKCLTFNVCDDTSSDQRIVDSLRYASDILAIYHPSSIALLNFTFKLRGVRQLQGCNWKTLDDHLGDETNYPHLNMVVVRLLYHEMLSSPHEITELDSNLVTYDARYISQYLPQCRARGLLHFWMDGPNFEGEGHVLHVLD